MSQDQSGREPELPPSPNATEIVWLAIVFEAGLVIVAMGLGWVLQVPPFEKLVASARAVSLGTAATLPMLVMLWWGVTRPDGMLGQVARQAEQLAGQLFARASVPELLLVSLAAGFGEEALFRGVLQTVVANFAGTVPGVIVAAILFGLAHSLSRAYAIIAAVIGLYFGWLYVATDNLMVPIVAHTLYDFFALLWLRKAWQ